MGDGVKKASQSEQKNRPIVRKSIVAAKDIQKGEVFTEENIAAKRPGTGINPMMWNRIVGKTAARNYSQDSLIEL